MLATFNGVWSFFVNVSKFREKSFVKNFQWQLRKGNFDYGAAKFYSFVKLTKLALMLLVRNSLQYWANYRQNSNQNYYANYSKRWISQRKCINAKSVELNQNGIAQTTSLNIHPKLDALIRSKTHSPEVLSRMVNSAEAHRRKIIHKTMVMHIVKCTLLQWILQKIKR